MEFYTLIFLAVALAGCLYLISQRSKANRKAAREFEKASTYEEKMMILQKDALKRLKGIDTTLDYFFWFFIAGLVLYFVYFFLKALALF